jgi:hypothetical protein
VPPCTAAASCATRPALSENEFAHALDALETATLSRRFGPAADELPVPDEAPTPDVFPVPAEPAAKPDTSAVPLVLVSR